MPARRKRQSCATATDTTSCDLSGLSEQLRPGEQTRPAFKTLTLVAWTPRPRAGLADPEQRKPASSVRVACSSRLESPAPTRADPGRGADRCARKVAPLDGPPRAPRPAGEAPEAKAPVAMHGSALFKHNGGFNQSRSTTKVSLALPSRRCLNHLNKYAAQTSTWNAPKPS